VGVENWAEVRAKSEEIKKAFASMVDLSSADAPERFEMKRIIDASLQQTFASRESVEAAFLQVPRMYFLPLGREYPVKAALKYQDQAANPYGGEAFPTNAVFQVGAHDGKAQRVTIKWSQQFDKAAATRIMQDTMAKLAAQNGGPPPDGKAMPALDINDQATYDVDANSGWIWKASHVHSSAAAGSSQKDTRTFVLRKADAK